MSDIAAIGHSLRSARRNAGLSQVELAELVGLSDRTVREIEKGSGSPSVAAVAAVASALGTHLGVAR